ncbi:hypothetical protein B0H14DRAFT_3688863 [Mycena olivaceomarginata]|nr:hypothetical protein B0H14DRAFT_3688863 [Mycena olivaceomarginata]
MTRQAENTGWAGKALSLPSPRPSVSKLLKFELPPQRKSSTFADPSDYLSEVSPTVVTFNVLEIPVPPAAVVKALGRAILSDPDMKSIVLVHSPAHRAKSDHYPLWLATIWSKMESARKARTLWRSAVDRRGCADRARAALQALENLQWDGVTKGVKASCSISDLASWFTTDWLNTDHMDQLLELLAADLGGGNGSTVVVETTYFVLKLAQAYSDPEEYRTGVGFEWLRQLGETLAMGKRTRMGGIANISDNHWIALAIDTEAETIGYGDGLRSHIDWWIHQHLGLQFKWTDLPIPKQIDAHSCGVLAYLSLAHWADTKRFPLLKSTTAAMADERLKNFSCGLLGGMRERQEISEADAHGYNFTFTPSEPIHGDVSEPEGNNDDEPEGGSSSEGSQYSLSGDSTNSRAATPSPTPHRGRATDVTTVPSEVGAKSRPATPPSPIHDPFPIHPSLSRPSTPPAPKRTIVSASRTLLTRALQRRN